MRERYIYIIYIYICVCVYVCVCIYICMYVMEYYSVIKKNEILPFETTWMDLEDIMLSEINKIKTMYISLICGT